MILIIGYGNILRSDDGIGIDVAKQIAEKRLAGVKVKTMQQLHVELLEEMISYEKTILIDAAGQKEDVSLKKVHPVCEYGASSSHFLSPELLLEMARTVYGKDLELYLCSIKGECFDVGDIISPAVNKRGKKALKAVIEFLKKDPSGLPSKKIEKFRCTECDSESCGVIPAERNSYA